jgi:hypothetical protein
MLRRRSGTSPAMKPMSTNSRIEDLPDFPILQQISSALWGTATTRGAAVMVGAGFSRNALRPAPSSRKPPLWNDFYNAMRNRLYPNGGNVPSDPLRLAEEYRSLLGRTALDTLICDLVRDTRIRRILLLRKGPRGPSHAGEKVLMVL